jgi:hypothetical protein
MIPLPAVARLYGNRGRIMFGLLLTLGAVPLDSVLAQQPGGVNLGAFPAPPELPAQSKRLDLSVYLKDPDGRPIQGGCGHLDQIIG